MLKAFLLSQCQQMEPDKQDRSDNKRNQESNQHKKRNKTKRNGTKPHKECLSLT